MSVRQLLRAAKAFERDVVIPHCRSCKVPCCGLSEVVLELSYEQAHALYGITKKSKLPAELKKQGASYFAHGAPCPAYTVEKTCRVYGTKQKPQECSDFPVYADDDVVTADLRCEALRDNLAELRARLRDVDADVVEEVDSSFPETFLSFLPGSLR